MSEIEPGWSIVDCFFERNAGCLKPSTTCVVTGFGWYSEVPRPSVLTLHGASGVVVDQSGVKLVLKLHVIREARSEETTRELMCLETTIITYVVAEEF